METAEGLRDPYTQRLADWAGWFAYNHDRLQLYFWDSPDALTRRFVFLRKVAVGNYELLVNCLERLNDAWDRGTMPTELVARIQQDAAWFRQHSREAIDPDQRYRFLVQAQAKTLELLRMMGEAIDHLERGQVQAELREALERSA